MENFYDYKKAIELIELEKENGLISADMGMAQDWFWTANEVWNKEDGYININDNNSTLKDFTDEDTIAGINGSFWATPIIKLYFTNDLVKELVICR